MDRSDPQNFLRDYNQVTKSYTLIYIKIEIYRLNTKLNNAIGDRSFWQKSPFNLRNSFFTHITSLKRINIFAGL